MARGSIVIVGGGIAGLCAAWELSGAAAGPDADTPRIEIVEASERFGGALATTRFEGRTIDLGADGFLARRPEAVALVRELGIGDALEAIDASGAWIWLRGELCELPTGLALGVPTSAAQVARIKGLSWRARLAARRDEWLPVRMALGDDATIGDIVRTKLGREINYQFVEPLLGGIQAGRIDDLSAQSVFPPLLEAARQGGSLMKALQPKGPVQPGPAEPSVDAAPMFYSLTGGVGSIPIELARRLAERGVVLRTGVAVTALRRTPSDSYPWEIDTSTTTTPADAVILATPAPVVGRLLGDLDERLERLTRIPSAGAAMVTFAIRADEVTLPPSGTSTPVPLGTKWSGEGSMMVTAVTLLDRKWPHLRRDGEVVLRAHVGRIDDSRWLEMSDDDLASRVGAELGVLLGRFGTPNASLVQRWPQGLPQYYLGHQRTIADAKAAATAVRVALCGSAYDGVGIPAGVGSGRRAAREVLAMVRSNGGGDV
jgi:oxygen-dependent protoporphyrinogen oxidase